MLLFMWPSALIECSQASLQGVAFVGQVCPDLVPPAGVERDLRALLEFGRFKG